jgi:hypothetical protein
LLVEHAPRLVDLRREVEARPDSGEGNFCANQWWHVHFRFRMMKPVSDLAERDDPINCSSKSYDLAYRTLDDLPSRCRHEDGCYWGQKSSSEIGNRKRGMCQN